MEIAKSSEMFKGLIGLLGMTKRVNSLSEEIKDIRKEVRYEVTCDKIVAGLNTQFTDIKRLQKETRDDVKELLKR